MPRGTGPKRVALVTGAGGGVGQCCAVAFARDGYDVLLWDLSEEDMKATARAVTEAVPDCRWWLQRVDVADRIAVYKAAEEVKALVAPGYVAILVNNAGIAGGGSSVIETEDIHFINAFKVNALAQVWTCKAFLPAMIEAGYGHIVTVASVAGLLVAPGMVDYGASKAAAVAFTDGLRRELHELTGGKVRTTLVCPAHIKTKLFQGFNQHWTVPSLEPEYVASQIVDAVRHRREMLIMPWYTLPMQSKGLLPVSVLDALLRRAGFSRLMEKWDSRWTKERVSLMTSSKL